MNNILKYLSAAAQAKLQASPTILARIPADIARIEADALAEAKAEFAIMEKAELEKKQQEAKIKAEQEARSKEAYTKEVDKKHSVINEQHKGNYGEVALEDNKQGKIYPISTKTTPQDTFSLFEGKSSPFLPKTQEKQDLKVSLGSNSVSNNYDPYSQVKNTTYSVPNTTEHKEKAGAIKELEKKIVVTNGAIDVSGINNLPNFSKPKPIGEKLPYKTNVLTSSIGSVTSEDLVNSAADINERVSKLSSPTKKVDLTRADRPKKVSKATQPITEQSVTPEEIKAKLEIDEAAKLTTPVVPQETAPSSIVEELKPQEPQVLEDKKVAKLSPEPVKPEGQEIPKEPSVNLEEEQKAKLLQEEETKKLLDTKAKEEEKKRLEEERLAEIADNEAKIKASEAAKSNLPKESELPKITSEPKVADAQKVEPKVRVIPPKDIKPIQADSLVSFDTETTGIDTKKSRIWQVGSATNLGEGKDYHLNPFDTNPRNSESFFQSLKNANGVFSEKAAAAGNFTGAISDFKKEKLVNLNQGLIETVGKFENTSVAVLQNANFENRLIQSAVDRGDINRDTLNNLSSKFMNASVDKQGKLTGALFNTSSKVKDAMREAEYTFRTKFMPSRSEESFKTYTDFLNTAYRQYGDDIISAKAVGKIASVELIDISKIFYANLAERNLISKNSVQLGLNIEFLATTLLGETEKHLASSDSFQTIKLFEKLNTHIGDMLSGNITDNLKEDAAKIRENQPAEVNKKFLSTLNSRLEDLERRGYTYQTNSAFSFYSPESIQKNTATGEIETVAGISLNNEKMQLTTMEDVIQDTFRSYEHYSDNLEGFNRAAYSTKLQEDIGKGSKLGDILSTVQNTTPEVEGPTLPFNYETDFEAKGQGLQKAARDISGDTIFLGKQMKKSTAGAILAGTAATLGVMAMTDNPNKNEIDQNAPVFENFYDEQYLGTAFVEFRDRNKRYVY